MPKLPDRWEAYTPIGEVIAGTRLVTFKVPLKEALCRHYEQDLRFTPQDLVSKIQEKGKSLGLVIDLTFTTRYYNPQELMQHGVLYRKIFTEGHVVPKDGIIFQFYDAVDDFLEKNKDNDSLIGVHCTHGVNRTGYIVCRYMVEKLGFGPEEALAAYAKARGYPVERENYIADLHKRTLLSGKGSKRRSFDEDQSDVCVDSQYQHPRGGGDYSNRGRSKHHQENRRKDQQNGYWHSGQHFQQESRQNNLSNGWDYNRDRQVNYSHRNNYHDQRSYRRGQRNQYRDQRHQHQGQGHFQDSGYGFEVDSAGFRMQQQYNSNKSWRNNGYQNSWNHTPRPEIDSNFGPPGRGHGHWQNQSSEDTRSRYQPSYSTQNIKFQEQGSSRFSANGGRSWSRTQNHNSNHSDFQRSKSDELSVQSYREHVDGPPLKRFHSSE